MNHPTHWTRTGTQSWIWACLWLAFLWLAPRSLALEVDCRACNFCRNKPDLLEALDERLRAHLAAHRTAREIAVMEAGDSLVRPAIERWANAQPGAVQPDRKRLKYRGSGLPDGLLFSSYEPSIRLNHLCIGTDKLGHFFQQGWEYYQISVLDGKGETVARRYGEWLEGVASRATYADDEPYFLQQRSGRAAGYGGFGRTTSGVISHADLAANLAGLQFYKDLAASRFLGMARYVTTNWCEELNPNDYTPAMAALIARNSGARSASLPGTPPP